MAPIGIFAKIKLMTFVWKPGSKEQKLLFEKNVFASIKLDKKGLTSKLVHV